MIFSTKASVHTILLLYRHTFTKAKNRFASGRHVTVFAIQSHAVLKQIDLDHLDVSNDVPLGHFEYFHSRHTLKSRVLPVTMANSYCQSLNDHNITFTFRLRFLRRCELYNTIPSVMQVHSFDQFSVPRRFWFRDSWLPFVNLALDRNLTDSLLTAKIDVESHLLHIRQKYVTKNGELHGWNHENLPLPS